MGVLSCLASLWSGNASKGFLLRRWLPLLLALWGGCFALSWRAYPGYRMVHHDISFLGHPRLNPQGWGFWSMGMGIAGTMLLPLTSYASRRMHELTSGQSPTCRTRVALGERCLRVACWGLLGLALIPQVPGFDLGHQAAGALAFGGFYVTVLFLWLIPFLGIPELSTAMRVGFAFSAWWSVVGFLATQGYRFFAYGELGRRITHKGQSVLLRFSLWEWMLFVGITSSFVLLVVLLTDCQEAREGAPHE